MSLLVKSGSGATAFATGATSLGARIVPTIADVTSNVNIARAWVWECTTSGTTNGTPIWPASVTQDVTTVTQNSVVFKARKPGFSSGSTVDWTFATIYWHYAALAAAATGERIYLSNNHAETQSTALTPNVKGSLANMTYVLCVDDTKTTWTGADLRTTASITVGTATYTPVGNFYCYGVQWLSSGILSFGDFASGQLIVLDNNFISLTGAGSGSVLQQTAQNVGGAELRLLNCTYKLANAANFWNFSGRVIITGGSFASGSVAPSALIAAGTAGRGDLVLVENLDMTNAGSSAIIFKAAGANGFGMMRNCTLPSGFGFVSGTIATPGCRFAMYNCDSGTTNYAMRIADYAGVILVETTIVMTGGASDGTTTISWKLVSNANCSRTNPLYSDELDIWQDVTGSGKTGTVEILRDNVTGLDSSQIAEQLTYPSSAGAPLGVQGTSGVTNVIDAGSTYTTSSATWTTTGMSNPNKQSMAVSFTPQAKGPLIPRVALTAASQTIYVNPVSAVA